MAQGGVGNRRRFGAAAAGGAAGGGASLGGSGGGDRELSFADLYGLRGFVGDAVLIYRSKGRSAKHSLRCVTEYHSRTPGHTLSLELAL